MILMGQEHASFWRNFCQEATTKEGEDAKEEFLTSLMKQARKELTKESSEPAINKLDGGLNLAHITDPFSGKLEKFVNQVRLAIEI